LDFHGLLGFQRILRQVDQQIIERFIQAVILVVDAALVYRIKALRPGEGMTAISAGAVVAILLAIW
jgi:hypothetical protein